MRLYLNEIGLENAWFGASSVPVASSPTATGIASAAAREIKATLDLWETLYRAVEIDILGLEKAIAQERQDTLVREEMKVRVEEETIAEVERLRERDAKSLRHAPPSPTTSWPTFSPWRL